VQAIALGNVCKGPAVCERTPQTRSRRYALPVISRRRCGDRGGRGALAHGAATLGGASVGITPRAWSSEHAVSAGELVALADPRCRHGSRTDCGALSASKRSRTIRAGGGSGGASGRGRQKRKPAGRARCDQRKRRYQRHRRCEPDEAGGSVVVLFCFGDFSPFTFSPLPSLFFFFFLV